jgi:microcystin-dependent protein
MANNKDCPDCGNNKKYYKPQIGKTGKLSYGNSDGIGDNYQEAVDQYYPPVSPVEDTTPGDTTYADVSPSAAAMPGSSSSGCSISQVYISDGNDGNTRGDMMVSTAAAVPCGKTMFVGNLLNLMNSSGFGIPKGIITMWSGSTSSVPSGWALCDGTNNTPDLRGKFVVGKDNSTFAAPGNTGGGGTDGSNNIQLNPKNIPSHFHDMQNVTPSIASGGIHQHFWQGDVTVNTDVSAGKSAVVKTRDINTNDANAQATVSDGNHTHIVQLSGNTGGGVGLKSSPNKFSILPKYYVVAYIIKL